MLRNWVKIILFLSSYIPLYLIIGIRNYQETNLVLSLGILTGIVLLILLVVLWRVGQRGLKPIKIDRVENLNKVGLEYMITYIIPFLTINFLDLKDIFSVGIVFFVMGVIYMKSDLIYMNPILNLAGYNLFKVISGKYECVIITRKAKHELEDSEGVIELADQVYYDTRVRVNGVS